MGFARHLTSTEIFEQARTFSAELTRKGERLSNVVRKLCVLAFSEKRRGFQ